MITNLWITLARQFGSTTFRRTAQNQDATSNKQQSQANNIRGIASSVSNYGRNTTYFDRKLWFGGILRTERDLGTPVASDSGLVQADSRTGWTPRNRHLDGLAPPRGIQYETGLQGPCYAPFRWRAHLERGRSVLCSFRILNWGNPA